MPGSTSHEVRACDRGRGRDPRQPLFRRASRRWCSATHALPRASTSGETYTCLPRADDRPGEALAAAILRLPEAIYDGEPEADRPGRRRAGGRRRARRTPASRIREGSYFIGTNGAPDADRRRRSRHDQDARRAQRRRHLRKARADHPQADPDPRRRARGPQCQEPDQPWKQAQVRLRIAWSNFVRDFGPINTHRRVIGRGRRDRRGAGDTPPAEPRPFRRRSRLLARRLDRGLRPREQYREAWADLHRAGDRPAAGAGHHLGGRRARRRAQRARPCRPRSHRRTPASRSRTP